MSSRTGSNEAVRSVVLSVLREAQETGVTPLLHTVLHKFVYLVDLYVAEAQKGKTQTDARWKFLHFGPFSVDVAATMEELAGRGDIFAERKDGQNDIEYRLYNLRRGLGTSLVDIGVPSGAALRIRADLKRYARNLSALLDYIYFRTSPMQAARPGEILDFSHAEPFDLEQFKPVAMRQIPKKKLQSARAKLKELSKLRENQRQDAVEVGPYDEAYYLALDQLELGPISTGLSGHAKIETE